MEEFKVIRAHDGDKFYNVGDTRIADPLTVRHLIGSCLEKTDAKNGLKAAKPLKNKAAK